MPFEIPVIATGFGAPFQPAPGGDLQPRFRNRDLVRAAIMAGHPNGAGNAPDPRIRAWRIATIKLAVQHAARDRLTHPRALQQLDPTEKGQVRNLLGNTITKLLCERLLQAPLMVFLDLYGSHYNFRFRGIRPDYIAQTLGGAWFTVEAKGRNRMASPNTLARIKRRQAAAVPVAQPGALQAHVVSWIGQRHNRVEAAIHDPEPSDELKALPLETAQLVANYYAPALDILGVGPSDNHLVVVEGADLSIGLHPELAWLLRSHQYEKAAELLRHLNEDNFDDATRANREYAPDGMQVVLGGSWPQDTELSSDNLYE